MRFHYIIKTEGRRAVSSDTIMLSEEGSKSSQASHKPPGPLAPPGWVEAGQEGGGDAARPTGDPAPREVWAETTPDSKPVSASPNERADCRETGGTGGALSPPHRLPVAGALQGHAGPGCGGQAGCVGCAGLRGEVTAPHPHSRAREV